MEGPPGLSTTRSSSGDHQRASARLQRARRARLLRARLDQWIELQQAELDEFADRTESEAMEGSLTAFEAVRDYLDTGRQPMFMTLRQPVSPLVTWRDLH